MKSFFLLPMLAVGSLALSGCTTVSNAIDAINPFASSAPKMTPLQPFTAAVDVKTLWSVGVGKSGDYAFQPAAVGDAIYAAGQDGVIRKFVDGKQIWKIDAGQPLSAGVGANEKMLVVGTAKGDVIAFAVGDGKPLWRAKVSSEVLSVPAVGDDGVAVRSGDNRIFLFDGNDGARKWLYQRPISSLSIRGAGAPVFADRYVFAGFPGGKLIALALNNGAPVWEGTVSQPKGATEVDRMADIVASPVVDGRQICAVAFQGRIACFDLGQGGAMIWSRDLSSATGLALDGRYLFVADEKGVVYGLDRLSGSGLWKQDKLKNRRVSAPVVRRGQVVVADGEGILHFLSREDGSFLARQKTDGTAVKTPLQALGSSVLVQTSGGTVAAIESQ